MIIGLNGFKSAGKNTVGEYLEDKYGFEQASFAAKLKESAAALFDMPPEDWEWGKNDPNATVSIDIVKSSVEQYQFKKSITVREFLQRYGTEAHRDVFGTDFWVDYAMKGIDPNKNIVFTDARFENELQRIKSFGGYNLQVLRPSLFTSDSHASEVPPPQHLIDYAVDNHGSFEDLYAQVDDFIDFIDTELFITPGTYGDWRDNPGNYGE